MYSCIEPLSETELAWALRYFENVSSGKDQIPAEFEVIEAERLTDARFRIVADYIFRYMYRDSAHPAPLAEDVDYAAGVFQRIAPQWWRTMGTRIFR